MADWVGAIGGLLAVIAAVISWVVSKQILRVEERRDAKGLEDKKREQAEHVYAGGIRLKINEGNPWGVFLHNSSDKIVTNVVVKTQWVSNEPYGEVKEQKPLSISLLPPGRFVVPPSDSKDYEWAFPVDLSHANIEFDWLLNGRGAARVHSIEFTDAAGRRWTTCRDRGLELLHDREDGDSSAAPRSTTRIA